LSQSHAVGASLFLPWWEEKAEDHYLVRTSMKARSGEGLLVDPGSPDNLVGSAWSKRMADLMVGAGGPPPVYEPHFLEVGGVGKGSMQCNQKVTHHIVCPTSGGKPVAGTFSAPELESDRVPALLGLKSLTKMRAIMDMDPAHPRLIVPGPGGVQLQCAPGTVIHPLEPTHSGHLLMPCSELTRRPGEEFITLLAGVHDAAGDGHDHDTSGGGSGRGGGPHEHDTSGGGSGRGGGPHEHDTSGGGLGRGSGPCGHGTSGGGSGRGSGPKMEEASVGSRSSGSKMATAETQTSGLRSPTP
jgi:hypothetical protein